MPEEDVTAQHDVRTCERTDEELRLELERYVRSKTVNGKFCPTPDLSLRRTWRQRQLETEEMCGVDLN